MRRWSPGNGATASVKRARDSITLIAYDAEGMGEAVGTLYAAVAGLDPLTRYRWPNGGAPSAPPSLAMGKRRGPVGHRVDRAVLPDRVLTLKATDGGLTGGDRRTAQADQDPSLPASKVGSAQVVGAAEGRPVRQGRRHRSNTAARLI